METKSAGSNRLYSHKLEIQDVIIFPSHHYAVDDVVVLFLNPI